MSPKETQQMVNQLTLAQLHPVERDFKAELTEGLRVAFRADQAGWWDAMAMFGLLPDDEPCAVCHTVG